MGNQTHYSLLIACHLCLQYCCRLMKKLAIDLNSDVGEGFGPYRIGDDEAVFPYITSANIACGFHAGDPDTMRRTLDLAAKYGVKVGAHPGYPDRMHFGRLPLPYSPYEVVNFVLYQIGALQAMAQTAGLIVHHLKLHGALYHQTAEDRLLSEVLLDAVVRLHPPLIIVGPPGSVLQKEAEERGLDYAAEGFADRAYGEDGKLVSRNKPRAVMSDPDAAADQALALVKERIVTADNGMKIEMKVHTICIHSDTPGAGQIAAVVRQRLEQAKIAVEPLHHIVA